MGPLAAMAGHDRGKCDSQPFSHPLTSRGHEGHKNGRENSHGVSEFGVCVMDQGSTVLGVDKTTHRKHSVLGTPNARWLGG